MDERSLVLLDRLSMAATHFAAIADKLVTSAGMNSPEFHELLKQTRSAHAKVEQARAEFEQHRDSNPDS